MAEDQTRAVYDTVAASYDELLGDTRYEAGLDLAVVAHLLGLLGPGTGAEVLDAGCGTGRMMTHLLGVDPSLRLTGVDLSPGMLERARQHHPRTRLEVGDLAALPLADDGFDAVLAWYSIIHTPPAALPRVLAELARVLRPGGWVLLGFHAGAGQRVASRPYGHDVALTVQLHEVDAVAAAVARAGFEVTVRLERAAREHERGAQGFVLARLPGASAAEGERG